MRVSFLMPAYNEAATIVEVLEAVSRLDLEKQLIVVDDGSTDGTGELVERWREGRDGVVLITQAQRGKGAELRHGGGPAERAMEQHLVGAGSCPR